VSAVASAWETVIGLEIHVQLSTRSKMLCGCATAFGAPPNTLVCPVCLGLPGALPAVNAGAVELAVRAAIALGCEVRTRSRFARKNYFYPDLPKGYQITQFAEPLAVAGALQLADEGGPDEMVRIRRLHLEEDAGKSIHDRFPRLSAVDLNRAGVPLIEIVTEPDLRSPGRARAFLGALKQTLEYLEVSDCNMEQGSLRVDANVSVRRAGDAALGTKTEVKNMNSFSELEKALEFEAARQIEVLEGGGAVDHQTVLWDAVRDEARPLRGKEEVHDYRYFPEPDLPPLVLDSWMEARLRAALPELPLPKRRRFVERYGLPEYDAGVLTASRGLADYYEALVATGVAAKQASNWLMGEVMAVANECGLAPHRLGVEPDRLAELIRLVEGGSLPRALAKRVMARLVETGRSATAIVEEEGLRQVSDRDRIASWVRAVLEENPGELERYESGEERLFGFFMGQVMRKSRGKADPALVRELLGAALERPD